MEPINNAVWYPVGKRVCKSTEVEVPELAPGEFGPKSWQHWGRFKNWETEEIAMRHQDNVECIRYMTQEWVTPGLTRRALFGLTGGDMEWHILQAKSVLCQIMVPQWNKKKEGSTERNGVVWIRYLQYIADHALEIREQIYAGRILRMVGGAIDTQKKAKLLKDLMYDNFHDAQRLWFPKTLDKNGVITKEKLRAMMLIRRWGGLPSDMVRLVLGYF